MPASRGCRGPGGRWRERGRSDARRTRVSGRAEQAVSDERPDALLRSALEKIVYFEARADQLHNELDVARREVERLRR